MENWKPFEQISTELGCSILVHAPGVINPKLIENAFLESVQKPGSRKTNSKKDKIDFDKITAINLELKNILKIDHLWILPNLTKLSLNLNRIEKIENLDMLSNLKYLNLSFNFIKKIENLNSLRKLENLSLFSNQIKSIENLETLENLQILDMGDNMIEAKDGIEKLLWLENLQALKLCGNPVTTNDENKTEFRIFIAGLLPNLKYYDNIRILKKERDDAELKYRQELLQITLAEQNMLEIREKQRKYESLLPTFVESLDENQFYESLLENDPEGDILRMIDPDTVEKISNQYKKDIFELTQEIYKIGITKYHDRLKEIEMYEMAIEKHLENSAQPGRELIQNVVKLKSDVIAKLDFLSANSTTEETTSKTSTLIEKFYEKLDEVFLTLIEQEIHAYNVVKNITTEFGKKLKEIIGSLRWETQNYFIELRNLATNFSKDMHIAVTQYFCDMAENSKHNEIPEKLKELILNDDLLANTVYYMKYNHLDKIDEREDRLISRGEKFIQEFLKEKEKHEEKDHKARVAKIAQFIDEIKDELKPYKKHLEQNESNEDKLQEVWNLYDSNNAEMEEISNENEFEDGAF